jgi:hemolysin III
MHTWAFVAAIPAGAMLLLSADSALDRLAAAVYAATLVLLFGTSAAYHRLTKCERSRTIMQRFDHSMIYLLIVGTYTPFCLVVLSPAWGLPFLGLIVAVSIVGIVLKFVAFDRAERVSYALYPILGWASVIVAPALASRLSFSQIALIVGGGLAYSIGLPVLLAKRPNPWPDRFGYHEIWHVLTIVAAALHFVAIRDVFV